MGQSTATACATSCDERRVCRRSGGGGVVAAQLSTHAPRAAQAEACDHLSSVLFLQSMAGGTGAGFGSFVVETVRHVYLWLACWNGNARIHASPTA